MKSFSRLNNAFNNVGMAGRFDRYRRERLVLSIQGLLCRPPDDGAAFETPETNDDNDYTSFTTATFNDDFDTYKETFDQILGTVIVPSAVGKIGSIDDSADGEYISLLAQSYAGYISVAIAGRVEGDQGMDDDGPAHVSTS